MFIGNTFFKCDAFLHTRLPEEIKTAFKTLAKAKGKTVSAYVLELVIKELEEEGGFNVAAIKTQNRKDHEK